MEIRRNPCLEHSSSHAPAPLTPARQRAPGLLKVLREADPGFVLLDGTLAECDRVGDSRADYSANHRRRGVEVQVVTDPAGRLLWLSPAPPGRAHDLTAARTHRIIRTSSSAHPNASTWPSVASPDAWEPPPSTWTTLRRLVHGDLSGMFDAPSTVAFEPAAPMLTIDLSRLGGAGDDTALVLAMPTCSFP